MAIWRKSCTYKQQPEGFIEAGCEDQVWKLKKTLYGLKQSPRSWYLKLDAKLEMLNFRRCVGELSVYVRQTSGLTIVTLYVDDLLVVADN